MEDDGGRGTGILQAPFNKIKSVDMVDQSRDALLSWVYP
jgi:hypothetical protein